MNPQPKSVSGERLSQNEFWQWLTRRPASDINHYELIHGRIVMTPPAGWPHGVIGANLIFRLKVFVEANQLGVVLDSSTGYELPTGDTVEPEVSFILQTRLAAGPKPETGKFIRIVPNLVIEILSASTSHRDRAEKKQIYQTSRVDEYWIVDPRQRTIAVFALGPTGYDPGTTTSDGIVQSRLLSGLEFSLESIFTD